MRHANRINTAVFSDLNWWHWAVTIGLLASYLFLDIAAALPAAIGLCVVMGFYFYVRTRSLRAMPVQLRIGFLILLLEGTLPHLWWVHWSQLTGASAMVLFGYCPLLRMLVLLPWNRKEELSWRLARWSFFQMPVAGGLLSSAFPQTIDGAVPSCSLGHERVTA